jgi:putative transposase
LFSGSILPSVHSSEESNLAKKTLVTLVSRERIDTIALVTLKAGSTSMVIWFGYPRLVTSNPRFLLADEERLKIAQSKRDKLPKGSPQRRKASKAVSHLYERVTNRREDFAQQLSRQWINQYGVIVFEDLNISKMVHNHNLAKSILDASWNKLVQYTSYKAEDAGRKVVLVNPANTSQMCSSCGQIVKKDLSIRVHDCPYCGLSIDRDLNAALNIARLGLQSLASA